MARKLTQFAVEKSKPHPVKRREIPDGGKPGLYLVVQPSGRKSWAVRYRRQIDSTSRKLTLDGFPSLATARKLAQIALDKVSEGFDPAAEKRIARTRTADESDLFGHVAGQFLERHVKRNTRVSSARETERLLSKEILPRWATKRVQEITKRHVVDLLEGIIDRGGGLTANRTLSAVRKLFNWAVQHDIIDVSPAAGVSPLLVERSRKRILSHEEMRWLWRACERLGYPFGPFVQLLLLTGQRRREVAGMRYCEIDPANRCWIIPGERTKNDEPHEVPLSHAAVAILDSVPRFADEVGYVFSTRGATHISGFSAGKAALDRAMLAIAREEGCHKKQEGAVVLPPWRLHDLRRTAASGMARLAVPLPVVEKVLNHSSGTFAGIVGVYQRHSFAEEKRKALNSWGSFLLALIADQPKIVAMRA
jgi:integrase